MAVARLRIICARWGGVQGLGGPVPRPLTSRFFARGALERGDDLIKALKAGDGELADEILSAGEAVDLEHRDAYGSTALTLAARGGHLDLCKALLKREPRPPLDAQNIFGSTALMCAAASGHVRVVEELLGHPVDVNVRSQYGSTALSKAAEAGHAEIVQKLIDRGADPTVVNKVGKSAADLAGMKGHSDLQEAIQAATAEGNEASPTPPPEAKETSPSAPTPLVRAVVSGLRAGNVVCRLQTAVQGPPSTVIAVRGDGLPGTLPVNEEVLLRRDSSVPPQGWVIVRAVQPLGARRPKQRCLHPQRPYSKKCVDCPDKRP